MATPRRPSSGTREGEQPGQEPGEKARGRLAPVQRERERRQHRTRDREGEQDAFQLPLVLGLKPTDMAMLVLTFLVSAVTLGIGRTYVMQGAVHLVLFAAFLFLAFVP
jgi:hypothetical protein